MNRATYRIMRGEDIDQVLHEEDSLMTKASGFLSGIKNFSFGSGVLSKVAGGTTGGGGPTTTSSTTGNTSAPNPGFGGKSMAQMAQDAAKSSGVKQTAPSAPASKPASESSVPMPRMTSGNTKASSLSKSLRTSSSVGDSSLKSLSKTAIEMIEQYS